jgi:hypothetical protein
MNQRRPGANSGMFSGLAGASHRIKNPKSRLGFLAAARADRPCGTDYLDKTLWVQDRLSRLQPVQWPSYFTAPASPWGLFLRRRHPVERDRRNRQRRAGSQPLAFATIHLP